MSLRFLYLTGLSTHVFACVWYALACKNAVTVAVGEAVCREGTWAQHPGTAVEWCQFVYGTSRCKEFIQHPASPRLL